MTKFTDSQNDGEELATASPLPAGAVPLNSSSFAAASINTATLAATPFQFTYISGFTITGSGATAGNNIVATINGVAGAPLNYVVAVPTGVTTGMLPIMITFGIPLQSTAVNTAITVTVPSFGTGNTHAAVTATGFASIA